MRRLKDRNIHQTLIFKLTVGSLLIIIPLVFTLIFQNFYSINVLHKKVAESKKDTISLYMKQIDSELKNVDDYLLKTLTYDDDVYSFENVQEEIRIVSKVNITSNLVQDITSYDLVDGLFIYSKSNKDYLYSYSSRTNFRERKALENFTTVTIDDGRNFAKLGWFPVPVESSYYIMRIISNGDTYMGAWINVKTFIDYLKDATLEDNSSILLATTSGIPLNNIDSMRNNEIDLSSNLDDYYFTGPRENFMVIGKDSEYGKFRLLIVDNEKHLLDGLDFIQVSIVILSLLFVLAIPITIFILRKWIFKPVSTLKHAIDRIEGGELDYRIKDKKYPYEFKLLNNAFNNMTSQIKQLKIDVYEEHIQKQKAELQYLNLQIKPHFYLNAFNTIYSMAQMKDYHLIQNLVRHLADHLRYIVKGGFSLVPLEEELTYIKNFLEIQRIRSGDNLICNLNVDPHLMTMKIPPLVLHTFIENIVKHAFNIYEQMTVFIDVMGMEDGQSAKIVIQDSGKGFPTDALEKINYNEGSEEEGEHIGIWNIKQRLYLIYGDKAKIWVSNGENHGAKVEITLPFEKE